MQARTKQVTFFAAKLLLSIGVLLYIARGLDLHELRIHLLAVDPAMFAVALALVLIQTFVLNGRWVLIMRSLGVSIDWMAGWRILMISLWFNQVLPSSAGGDVVRIWLLRRRGVQWPQAVKGVMADRFTALLGLVALMVVGLPFLWSRVDNLSAILAIGGLTAAGVIGTIVLLTLDRWPARVIALRPIASFVQFGTLVRFLLLKFQRREILFGSAIVIHLMTAAASYVLAVGLQAQISILDVFILIPPVILLTAVPISISGWGVREGAMVACLALAGVPSDKALSISLLLGAISVIIGVIGGIIWLASPERGSYATASIGAEEADAAGQSLDYGLQQAEEVSGHP
ncbi:lysylphosphatidylglycerol synthase transmembrane domain-containing protein [Bradyrhizobium canariense]|uniref:TIGR00374 family protein n=1 Tax=Bradyrhizobium canariense TaxID=255045 RepID=A0A1H1QHS9_9BRAD|nr:lysylphosphatidylglycerol synthase transmembrane domain-containing protein [Bradyrhizobium canariense]SDS22877.1 hypothetical protein SAMN05444158_1406 [Bradyrhizobium canariense]